MAVAEASFNTVKLSISLGLTRERGLFTPFVLLLSIGIPSITINGLLLAVREAPPRIRICAPSPGAPVDELTFTPAILPWIISCAEVMIPWFFSSGLIAVTEPVKSFFLATP
ncbi:Uncharacterised protein [Segatella copri]|nr:Uncharacterised protein [Segatella copri]